ncbi:MAG: TDT family transporter [Actinobacteria bacterium]|nr:TDT family transporter [Actinomycetota bacterium]
MGTGIVANAAVSLPGGGPGMLWFGRVIWFAAALLLLGLSIAYIVHWLVYPDKHHDYRHNPVMAQFYGAPPMAFMTVAAGILLVWGPELPTWAIGCSWTLWLLGTAGGLVTAVWVPFRLFTSFDVPKDGAFGGWLMPVVPPMVSAATGALLVPHAATGVLRETMFYACYAMFGLSLMAAFIIITLIWNRLAHFGTSGSPRVPTLWIVLGPLGQSITAAGTLGAVAFLAVRPELAHAFDLFAVLYGVPVWGFAMLWAALATLLTIRARRQNMSFALTWWAFTFPVGTCVTGAIQLAHHTELVTFEVMAWLAFVGLLCAWLLVGWRTGRGLARGELLRPPPAGQPTSFKGKLVD